MVDENEIFDHINHKFNSYVEAVIKPLLPEFKANSKGSIFNADSLPEHGYIDTSPFNIALKGSDYYFQGKPYLVHFTNLEKAISIISEGHIRLMGLNKSSDKSELHFASKDIWPKGLKIEQDLLPGKFLNLSMCAYEPDCKDADHFDLWRFYGDNGNGVGIVFEFDFSNMEEWYGYHISKVYYGEDFKFRFKEIVSNTENWIKANKFDIVNYHKILLPLYSFHKIGHYKTENEVRLVKSPLAANTIEQTAGYTINEQGVLVNFEKLYFEGIKRNKLIKSFNMPEQTKLIFEKQMPKFRIKEIILGHAIGDRKKHELRGVLSLFKTTHDYKYDVIDSCFK